MTSLSKGASIGTGPVTLVRVVHSEWIKFRSLRSSYATLLAAAAALVGLGALICWVTVNRWDNLPPQERLAFSPAEQSLKGFFLAQLAVGVLGVVMVTGEYSSGLVRCTLAAVPRRLPMLWAKAAVFGGVTLVMTTAASLTAFTVGQRVLSGGHLQTTLTEPGVLRVVLGTGLYLTAIGLLAVGIGAVVRNTAGGITAVLGLLLVLPVLVEVLPGSWRDRIMPCLPGPAGQSLTALHPLPHMPGPWTGFTVLCAYAAGALAIGAAQLRHRDA